MSVHVWVPNLYEFKGGIQVYLTDVLQVAVEELPPAELAIFDKLDRPQAPIPPQFQQIRHRFSGCIPAPLRTAHFSAGLLGAAIARPDLILCGHVNFAPVAAAMQPLTGIPYWLFAYGTDVWNVSDSARRTALQRAGRILSIGGYTRDRLITEQNIPRDRISILPVTFNPERFQIAPKPAYLLDRYDLTPEQPVILTVTRLSSRDGYKGYDRILRALPTIQQTLPDARYILAGKGDDTPRIRELARSLGIEQSVTLPGFIADEELAGHYNLCDVFAMPSKGEGFGIVYLEALASGKPALGGDRDGAIDALCGGKLGALVNPDDTGQLAETLLQILQRTYPNPLLYQPDALRQQVIEIFGFESFRRTLAQLLRESPARHSVR